MFKKLTVLFLLISFVLLAGCSLPNRNPLQDTPDNHGKIAGFWKGFWHATVKPVSSVWSLFNTDVTIYEVHNNGFWYNMGYTSGGLIVLLCLVVVILIFSGLSNLQKRRRW
jgi:hypothetical protein